MALAALRPCSQPGCPSLTRGGKCDVHRSAWIRHTETVRVRGRKLQRLPAELFAREPLCRTCWTERKKATAATIRDHIVPLAEGGTDDEHNIQPLCQTCSDAKTAREAQRGRQRGCA